MSLWMAILLAGALTYGLRLSFILGLERIAMPPTFRQALRFVPVTVLVALIVPELLLLQGEWNVSLHNSRLLAGFLAAVVAWRSRNTLLTIVVGMIALLVLEALLT